MFSRRTSAALALAGVCALATAASAVADPGTALRPAAPAAVAAPGKVAHKRSRRRGCRVCAATSR